MAVADEQQIEDAQTRAAQPAKRRRWRRRIALGVAAVALIGGSAAWVTRERIIGDVVDDYLASKGVRASYDIAAITPQVQVIENLVIGDPARPDLTARRLVIELGIGWAGPEVRRVTVEGARAFATYRSGTFSLGALDPLIFTDRKEPPALPALNLTLTDARALVESDYGRIGLALNGTGRLDDGFAGVLAANAPGIGVEGCRAVRATLYGTLTTDDGAPSLKGPLRIGDLVCGGARLARADIGSAMKLSRNFSAATGDFRLKGADLAHPALAGAGLDGTARIMWGGTGLALEHDLSLTGVSAPQGRIARLTAEGQWRGPMNGTRGEWEGALRAAGIAPDAGFTASLAEAEAGLEGTLLAPLIAKVRGGFARSVNGSSLSADAIIRHSEGRIALIIPEARIASRAGTPIAALSQLSAGISGAGLTGLRGNILVGGDGLPSINGRMEQQGDGAWVLRMAMAEYSAGANRLAIPRLALRQERGGTIRFDGQVDASGDLPGGGVTGLAVPLEGTWNAARGLALGTRCTPLRFTRLAVSGLALKGQVVTLCPEGGAPILAYENGLRLAASTGPLNLSGTLGESPASLSAAAVRLRYPAPFAVDGLTALIGEGNSTVTLSAASLSGSLAGDIGGQFAGGAAQMAAVPLDLADIAGRWSFADGAVRVDEAAFTLTDRPAQGSARFNRLIARAGNLVLRDNRITAAAALRHPGSGRTLADVTIAHDLESAIGNARLAVPGVVFDSGFQPEDISELAKGVIALADGSVTGNGRIDWTADAITSSGTFRSDTIDFAAAFGPVRGLAGEVVFTDLLNLTTAPDQQVTIAALNPGVEVLDGVVQFELKDGTLLSLERARFPFMGGELQMRPLVMDFGQPETRRYVFEITGLDAATFVAQMQLTNLSATGVFDGTVPIVFDENGNGRIDGGLLISRAGGGNVAYVGDLTYEDLGAMGNYAFSALRSLDYRQMQVGLNGSLSGEIITNLDFDGVRQGAGTSQNFVTRRLAKLPIRFKVNVRSENFHELATMVRSFWDVDFLGNPVDRGLLRTQDGRFVPARPAAPTLPPAIKPVQPSESDNQP